MRSMPRFYAASLLVAAVSAVSPVRAAGDAPVTFNKDVLPILQKNCQVCHRPGEVAPMSFLTYETTRPWAKAIKNAVMTKKMPPWFADPQYGHFQNAPKLTEADVQTISAWADTGALEGESKDRPMPTSWTDGWYIKPDVVISMSEPYQVPAEGVVELVNFTVPSGFTKDTWITSIEIRPGNPSVVHHVVLSFRPHRDDVKYGVPQFIEKPRDEEGVAIKRIARADEARRPGLGTFTNLEAVYVPGVPPTDYRIHKAAKLVPAGTDIVIQMHYTPNGRPTTDQTKIGFTLATGEPERRFITLSPTSLRDAEKFRIPANDPNWESRTEVTFDEDGEIVWFMPHMHWRGKDMTYRLVYPNGDAQIVMSVPKYNFDWQLGYDVETPVKAPRGTKLAVTAHYDNSAGNRFNPNPNRDVWWGDQTWEEMMVPWFGVVVARDVDPKKVVSYSPEYAPVPPK
jgi:hypothetical protein